MYTTVIVLSLAKRMKIKILGPRGCCEDGRGSLQRRVSEDCHEIFERMGGQIFTHTHTHTENCVLCLLMIVRCAFLQEIVTRMGRWIDFRKDYKKLYPWFMESIW